MRCHWLTRTTGDTGTRTKNSGDPYQKRPGTHTTGGTLSKVLSRSLSSGDKKLRERTDRSFEVAS